MKFVAFLYASIILLFLQIDFIDKRVVSQLLEVVETLVMEKHQHNFYKYLAPHLVKPIFRAVCKDDIVLQKNA